MGDGDVDYGGGVGSDNVYRGSIESMLIFLSNLYLEDNRILSR